MARPAAITDQQILDAARDAFLADGFQASTIDIAQRAGVSHGTLFKRFPTKADLFTAALGLPPDPDWLAGLTDTIGQGDLPHNLEVLVLQTMALCADILPRLVALRARGFAGEPRDHVDPDSPPARFVRTISTYLQAEMDLGRARAGDPEILAHALLGPAVNFVMLEVLGPSEAPRPSRAEFAARLIDLVWRGVAPAEG